MEVARDEGLAQPAHCNTHLRCHAQPILLHHPGVVAPGEEVRVMLNIRHQCKHFLRGIPDQDRFMDGFHEGIGSANTMHQDGTVCESRIGDQVPIVGKPFSTI